MSQFPVSGSWADETWYAILADICYDNGLSTSTDSSNHTITISDPTP